MRNGQLISKIVGPLLDTAIASASENESAVDWRVMLDRLDLRIRRNQELLDTQRAVPTELSDEYRKEIDSVMLDNMHLTAQLNQTKSALERSRTAHREETEYTALLKQKLDELEEKLVQAIRRKTMN